MQDVVSFMEDRHESAKGNGLGETGMGSMEKLKSRSSSDLIKYQDRITHEVRSMSEKAALRLLFSFYIKKEQVPATNHIVKRTTSSH
jgi:hypothetical protein